MVAGVEAGYWIFRVKSDNSRDVFLVGDFNDWSTTATPMSRIDDETFEVKIKLEPGQYSFRYFAIDDLRYSPGSPWGRFKWLSETKTLTVKDEDANAFSLSR